MLGKTKSAEFMLIGCGAAVVFGQSLIATENLLVSPPKDLWVGLVSDSGNYSMTEFVPADETVEDRTWMLTVQVFRHLQIDAATFLQRIGKKILGRVARDGRHRQGHPNWTG
jgi:hypothetical protein